MIWCGCGCEYEELDTIHRQILIKSKERKRARAKEREGSDGKMPKRSVSDLARKRSLRRSENLPRHQTPVCSLPCRAVRIFAHSSLPPNSLGASTSRSVLCTALPLSRQPSERVGQNKFERKVTQRHQHKRKTQSSIITSTLSESQLR